MFDTKILCSQKRTIADPTSTVKKKPVEKIRRFIEKFSLFIFHFKVSFTSELRVPLLNLFLSLSLQSSSEILQYTGTYLET